MNNSQSSPPLNSQPTAFVERRNKPRVDCSYPAQVNGYTGGMKFETRAILSNMSANGMYLRLKRRLEISEPVFIVVRLSTSPLKTRTTPRIAANGSVVRIDPKTDGSYGVAVQLEKHRFP